MIVDDMLHLFAFNFTTADTVKSRSFGVSTRDKSAVQEALTLFEADCTRQPFTPNKRSPLVVSPETARDVLTDVRQGRQTSAAHLRRQHPGSGVRQAAEAAGGERASMSA